MTGKIIKGIAGFYYVQTKCGVYECKAKGSFRNKKLKPFVAKELSDSSGSGQCGPDIGDFRCSKTGSKSQSFG